MSRQPFLERVYRRLLVLYPPAFRSRFEEEMTEFFRDRLREVRRDRGELARILVALGGLGNVVAGATVEHIDQRKRRRRDQRRSPMMDRTASSLRQATRALRHRPGLAAAVVATLALGIGANTIVFSVVDAVLLRSLPYPEPERIVTLWNRYGVSTTDSSPPDYMDRKEDSQLLSGIAAIVSRPMNLSGELEARRVEVSRVTSQFFSVMGVTPVTGPVVFPAETSSDEARSAVLSFGLSQSLYGEVKDAVGRSLRLDGESYVVAGVLPDGFDFPRGSDVFLPLVFPPAQLADDFRGNEFLLVIGRMKEGVELEALQDEMSAIAARVGEKVPRRRAFLERNNWGATVVPLREHLLGGSERALAMLFLAVLVVLAGTGANVAHLLLSSASARGRELAVRSSLGASRARLFGQLVTESLLLSVAGGLTGLVVAFFSVRALAGVLPSELPRVGEIALDARALLVTLAVTAAMGVACGLFPAWQGARAALSGARGQSSTRTARRLRSVFVTSEVALALVLLVAAALLVRSFATLASREPGFEAKGQLSFGLDFPRSLYPRAEERQNAARFLLERLRELPGVRSASASDRIPLDGRRWSGTFYPGDRPLAPGEPVPGADFNSASPGYLATLGIPLLRGRDFTPSDTAETPRVLLVDEWLERRFFPGGAVGRTIDFSGSSSSPNVWEIVGVVGHVHYESLHEAGRFQIYYPLEQASWRRLSFTVETTGDPASLTADLRREVSALSPDLAVHSVRSLDGLVSDSLAFRELQAGTVSAFGLLALALAAVGIYGVLSYSVSRRTMEVGVRMAFGASRRRVVGLVLREGLLLAALGLALGGLGALAFSRLLEGLLFDIEPTDPSTYAAVTLLLGAVALIAALIPALRASRLDPLTALREE